MKKLYSQLIYSTRTKSIWRLLVWFLIPLTALGFRTAVFSTEIDAEALNNPEVVSHMAPPSEEQLTPDTSVFDEHDSAHLSYVDAIRGVDRVSAREPQEPLELLGSRVEPASTATLSWTPQDIFEGIPTPTPVLVVNGKFQGPTICLTGAIHGDEINSIETIRRVVHDLSPEKMSGTVIGVPIVNQMGFRRGSRYLPDRRDLNRYFPGDPEGSSASRIAHSLFEQIIRRCDALLDLHTGSFHRTNVPQLRADLNDPKVTELARGFGGMIVLHSEGTAGMLRYEAVQAGIPALTLEAGEALRIQKKVVATGVKHINTLLTNLGVIKKPFFWSKAQPVYLASQWVRAEIGGIFISDRNAGDEVKLGEKVGSIVDPITNRHHEVVSPFSGKLIGMALNQVVLPGYAIYHIGIDADSAQTETPQNQQLGQALLSSREKLLEREAE